MKATGRKIDKIYMWQSQTNKTLDTQNGTVTFCMSEEPLPAYDIVFEECFSPLEGSCLGFRENAGEITPVCGEQEWTARMQAAFAQMQGHSCAFAKNLKSLFGPYLDSFTPADLDYFTTVCQKAFAESPYHEVDLLDSICFVDSQWAGIPLPLPRKLVNSMEVMDCCPTPFSGTGFEDPDSFVKTPHRKVELDGCLGIHIHLYNKHLAQEFIACLKKCPTPLISI